MSAGGVLNMGANNIELDLTQSLRLNVDTDDNMYISGAEASGYGTMVFNGDYSYNFVLSNVDALASTGTFQFKGSHDSQRMILRNSSNSIIHSLKLDGSAIFNEQGAAVDFRVESDNNTEMLLVDGSADSVNIGNDTFKFYSDGTSKGLPLTYNGGGANVGAGGSKKDIFFGVTNANGGLPIPANGTLERLGISTNSVTTSGKLRLYYSLNGGAWTQTTAELNLTDTWTSIDDTLSVSLTKGDRLQFQYWSDPDGDANAYAPTSAEPTITVYITTNE
jgi:hypothetical protein